MAIERLSFPEYLNIPEGMAFDRSEFETLPLRLLQEYGGSMFVLPEGDYDLTPKIWVRFTHYYKTLVLKEGDAWHRILPIDTNVGLISAEINGDASRFIDLVPGGRQIHLPDQGNLVVIAHNHEGQPRLYEILHHIPGSSPLQLIPAAEFKG